MGRSRRRRGARYVAALVLLVLATACGGPSSATGAAGGSSTAPVTGPAGTTEPEVTPSPDEDGDDGGDGDDGDGGFAYVPWGPDDPPVPGHYSALAASTGSPPRCDDLAEQRPDGEFWDTALAVCRALVEGAPWPEVTDAPAPPDAPNAYQSCLDQELQEVLQEALRWHAEHPAEQPRVTFADDGARSPCQDAVYAVTVLSEEDAFDGEADQGGRVPIAITLAGVDGDAPVTVAGQPAEPTGDYEVADPGDGLTTLVVLAAPPAQSGSAPVEVSTPRGPLTAEVDLPAPDGSGTPPPPTPDDEVGAETPEPGDDASAEPDSG